MHTLNTLLHPHPVSSNVVPELGCRTPAVISTLGVRGPIFGPAELTPSCAIWERQWFWDCFVLRGVKQVYTWWIMMMCTQNSKPIPNILKAWNMICLDIWFTDDWLRSWGYTSHGWSFEAKLPFRRASALSASCSSLGCGSFGQNWQCKCLQCLHKCTRAPQTRMIKMWESCHHMPPHNFGQQNQGVLTV